MSVSTGAIAPIMQEARDPGLGEGPPSDAAPSAACMFCSDSHGLRASGEDPMGFLAHLRLSDDCRREYELWKQVITDEWQGD